MGLDEDNSIINSFDEYRKRADKKYEGRGGYKQSVHYFVDFYSIWVTSKTKFLVHQTS